MAPLIDPALFEQLKTRIEEDTEIRKQLDKLVDDLSQHVSSTQGLLSRVHSTPRSKCLFQPPDEDVLPLTGEQRQCLPPRSRGGHREGGP